MQFISALKRPRAESNFTHSRKNFSQFTHSRKSFWKFRQTRFFWQNGEIFRKNGEICMNLDEKGKFTCSRKKRGTHSRNRKVIYHVHASFFDSCIHTIFFFEFSRIHATKEAHSRIHAGLFGPFEESSRK